MSGVRGGEATPGELRRTQNWIGPPGCGLNDAVFVPPPVHEMEPALAALEKYLHAEDEYPPLVRMAFVHYQFEAIHPFIDGNGRLGRLLLSLLMVHWELLTLPTPRQRVLRARARYLLPASPRGQPRRRLVRLDGVLSRRHRRAVP